MKRIILISAITVLLTFVFEKNYAQDQWVQGKSGIYSVGIGGAQLIYLNSGVYGPVYTRTSNIGLSINVSGEYKVWNWIGVGFQTGLDFMWYNYSYLGYHYRGGNAAIGIPIGVKANAHLLDAFNASIANKLDVYAGLGIGGGPLISTAPGGGVLGFMYVGPQFGARYWFGNIAIFGELGWGATFANVGVTF